MVKDANQSNKPLVSVILPVYNGALYLAQAIESILTQTYGNFELIIINDGSRDNSEEIIKRFRDERIKYISQQNQGLAQTLNNGIRVARGKYIARQDQDDMSLPERLEKQVDFLENHPDYGMAGTWARIISDSNPLERYHKHPADNPVLQFDLLFDNPFVHSSMMIRREVLDKIGCYSTDKNRQPPEDYELWSRIAKKYKVSNISEVLHIYREVGTGMSHDKQKPFNEKVFLISRENIAFFSGRELSDENVIELAELTHGCLHKLKINSRFSEIRELMDMILQKISGHSHGIKKSLSEKVEDLLDRIYPLYLRFRYGKLLGRILYRAVRFFRVFWRRK